MIIFYMYLYQVRESLSWPLEAASHLIAQDFGLDLGVDGSVVEEIRLESNAYGAAGNHSL